MNSRQKKTLAAVCTVFIVLVAVFALVMGVSRMNRASQAPGGSKQYTLTVVDAEGAEAKYSASTDAEFLKDALDELQAADTGFSYSGTDSDYGMMIDTVNGLRADYDADKAYWAIYVNDSYGEYGVSSQPVNDGDAFRLVYEK